MGTKVKNWTQLLKIIQTKGLSGEDYVLYKLAQFSPKDKAVILYAQLKDKFPSSDYAPEALWYLFWDKYSKHDYNGAKLLAEEHLKTFKSVNSTPRIAYWLAKTELKLNKQTEAHNILTKLISKYPDDYYGLRAEYLLNNSNNFWDITPYKALPKAQEIEFPITLSNLNIKDLKLINSLFELGDYDIWLDADFGNKIVESWFELRKDKKARSIVLARDEIKDMSVKPSILSAAYKLAYPLHYVEEINIAGDKTNISPYYIISLIKEESHFNVNAKSSTNATGLMQVMPSTANYMAAVLNVPVETLASLNDVKTNIYIGCSYLKYLTDKFGSNMLFVTIAYNSGEGALTKWLKTYNASDYDEFIENIPYDETRNYVRKVFRTYHMYRKIYK